MKEPGQIVWETVTANDRKPLPWGMLSAEMKSDYARVEAAIRASERERCAELVDNEVALPGADKPVSPEDIAALRRDPVSTMRMLANLMKGEFAAAIRALPNPPQSS